MLASVSSILRGDMEEHLEVIIRRMMETLTSEEGVKVSKLPVKCGSYSLWTIEQ